MKFKAFVLRLWRDEQGCLRGQLSDPRTGERVPFQDSAELWQLFQQHLTTAPPSQRPASPQAE